MKKHSFTAVFAASAVLFSLCGCTDSPSSSQEISSQTEIVTAAHDKTEYSSGTYSGEGFSLYADPRLWAYSTNDTCDLRMITDKDINTCGISVYVSEDSHGGKTAQEIVSSADNPDILTTGALSTAKFTFYYYEWAIDDDTHGRSYFADYNDKYLCVYAESTNFGYADIKIADLLSGLKTE